MLIRNILVTVLLGLPVAGVTAGSVAKKVADKQEIMQDRQFIKQTRKTLDKLNQAIDLWHDANLKGSEKKITSSQEKIMQILQVDISESWEYISESEIEVFESAEEFKSTPAIGGARRDDRADLRDDIKDLKQAKIVVRTKERLFSSIEESKAFSNKYRLLSDYADVLKKQLGISRIELAEDRMELREDRRPGFKR